MNMKNGGKKSSYQTLQLMSELEREESISQRELASRLGVAVGLVNSYLKNLVAKGFLRIKSYPRNRYAYLLTPKGVAEKSRLVYQHLHYFNDLYTVVRKDYLELFLKLRGGGVDSVVFCGVDEVAEIAYLSLQEAGLELAAVIDDQVARQDLFGCPLRGLSDYLDADIGPIPPVVITSLKRSERLQEELLRHGVPSDAINVVA